MAMVPMNIENKKYGSAKYGSWAEKYTNGGNTNPLTKPENAILDTQDMIQAPVEYDLDACSLNSSARSTCTAAT